MNTSEALYGATASNVASATTPQKQDESIQKSILSAMSRIDPFLRFLTKATGKTSVPLKMLCQVLPKLKPDATSSDRSEHVEKNDDDDNNNNNNCADSHLHEILLELSYRGVLTYDIEKKAVGFPLPPSLSHTNDACAPQPRTPSAHSDVLKNAPSKLIGKGLHGSSETSAKRRLKVLKWSLDLFPSWVCRNIETDPAELILKANPDLPSNTITSRTPTNDKRTCAYETDPMAEYEMDQKKQARKDPYVEVDERFDECIERAAYQALNALLSGLGRSFPTKNGKACSDDRVDEKLPCQWLPCQAAYAGSHSGRRVRYGVLSKETAAKIPPELLKLFDLDLTGSDSTTPNVLGRPRRRLFLHQARAIESAMSNVHTVVQTSTGSGKSLCFLLPVLAKAMISLQQGDSPSPGCAAIVLFPTKALAQDQFSKIIALLQPLANSDSDSIPIRAGIIDGDTPHSQRDEIAAECQIVLTNPDTLHAAMLPNWKKNRAYHRLLARITTVVIDESHVYEGAFGAHVAMVLRRLLRVCRVASSPSNTGNATSPKSILFISCSATMLHPEEHLRLLCPIGKEEEVSVLSSKDDGSPCPPKHFFVWNPPILDVNGISTESVFLPKRAMITDVSQANDVCKSDKDLCNHALAVNRNDVNIPIGKRRSKRKRNVNSEQHSSLFSRRRHAADETAFLLAKAISAGIRTIAFCRTRSLVEWVYARTLSILHSNPETMALVSKVDSYRGGYTAEARRSIEERLFQGKLIGVVGTNALELGIDVGSVSLTLHTGYPGSICSLLQQSGRSGREKNGNNEPSCAVMVSFSSPAEQYIWKNPKCLLSRGVEAPPTLPMNSTVVQGHMLCAGEEFPLTGDQPVSCLLNEVNVNDRFPADCEIFGPSYYHTNIAYLAKRGFLSCQKVSFASGHKKRDRTHGDSISVYSTHPVLKNPWKMVSLRSVEPLSYLIVDLSHTLQGGKTDKLYDQACVLDTIPYSRVFYHAFPGALILHRGRKYRIESMENPPSILGTASFGTCESSRLLAFAKPTSLQYSTQPLNSNQITVVKQLGHVGVGADYDDGEKQENGTNKSCSATSAIAGYGVVTVKRSVHGYKKLSHVNRIELSRTNISVPPMEFDTRALWIDADATCLRDVVLDYDGGVHALSHAMVAVAPLFVACAIADIDCDHRTHSTTRILLYDQRAGGSGVTAQLYAFLLSALRAAIELLEECTLCYSSREYDGGCPGCLQSVPCDNFHQTVSRNAGILIGKHLVKRLEKSTLKDQREADSTHMDGSADMQCSLKPNNIVIGRASWSPNNAHARWAEVDDA